MPENTTPSNRTDTEVADDLRAVLEHYGPEISALFGQVLSLYAGVGANTLDDTQKKARLRQKLEQSLAL